MTFEKKLARNLKTVTTFWRYVNNGMPVGDLEREDGTVATTDIHGEG